MDPNRQCARQQFLHDNLKTDFRVEVASADASFRSYFRVFAGNGSQILMDAPPDKEDCRGFIDIGERLRRAGLRAPTTFARDLDQGFLLLEDFGDTLYRQRITFLQPEPWFGRAFSALETMATRVDTDGLPTYDRSRLLTELSLFPDWYLDRQLDCPLSEGEKMDWRQSCDLLLDSAERQPKVFVHRDFHSCNLMDDGQDAPGIIDFQDAVVGPVSYDLVSFLLDRYISWPRQDYCRWVESFRRRLDLPISEARWLRDCDWMGLQRNLKVVGIFARLNFRDGKPEYLDLQPRFLDYVLDTLGRYPEFNPLLSLLEDRECVR